MNINKCFLIESNQFLVLFQMVLKEIREWLDVHPKEVVILSFSHFLGLSQELHTLLVSTVKSVFDSKLCPKMVRISFNCFNFRNRWWQVASVTIYVQYITMLIQINCEKIIQTYFFLTGVCNTKEIMEPGSTSYHFIRAQYCQLPQRIVVPYTLLVGKQEQGWNADRGIWT